MDSEDKMRDQYYEFTIERCQDTKDKPKKCKDKKDIDDFIELI